MGGVPVRVVAGDKSTPVIVVLDENKPLGADEQQRRIAKALLSNVKGLDANARAALRRIATEGASSRAQLTFSVINIDDGKPVIEGEELASHTPEQLAKKLSGMKVQLDKVALRVEPRSQVGGASSSPFPPFYNHRRVRGVNLSAALLYWPSRPTSLECAPGLYVAVGAIRSSRYTSAIVPVYVDAGPGVGGFKSRQLKESCVACNDTRCKASCLFNTNPFGDADDLARLIAGVVAGRSEPVASILSSLKAVAESIVGIGVPRLSFSLGPQVTWSWPNYLKLNTSYVTPYDLVARMPTYHFNVKHVESEAEARARLLSILESLWR